MKVQLEGKDSDMDDVMLNPAHVLVGAHGDSKEMAHAFADWIEKDYGGQKIVKEYKLNDEVLYTTAPRKKSTNAL